MDTRVTQVVDDVRRRLTDEFEQHQARAREREHAMQVLCSFFELPVHIMPIFRRTRHYENANLKVRE